jgi:uncharacterized protein YbbC (DUF1343 family)
MMKNGRLAFHWFICFLILTLAGYSSDPVEPDIIPGAYNIQKYLPFIQSKKVGLVVNQTSVLNSVNLVDTLINLGVDVGGIIEIQRIFTPEHGFKGYTEAGANINNEIYSNRRIPVISLYGKKRKPDREDLTGIEIMIFDLQDVGVRFYTYLSTLHYIMEACAEQHIPLIVLDRPNPNGFYIDGPVLDMNYRSFVGLHPVPVVYGMTIGEYALMINGEYWLADSLQCDLTIVPCANYTHTLYYTLPVPPSPNLPDMRSVYFYPSTCFFEGTVISEGRGTNFPFQLIGHPDFSDHSFSFIPKSMPGYSLNPKFNGKVCYGIDLRKKSIDSLRNLRILDLQYLKTFYDDLSIGDAFFTGYFDQLAGNNKLRNQIMMGLSPEEIRNSWEDDIEAFKKIRAKYLLYPDFE